MIESTLGVVLRTLKHGETSLIVRWLTADAGRVSTLAKGARRPGSVFAGRLDLFVQADVTFNRSRRSDLHTLREVAPGAFHRPLRNDVARLRMAAYCVELVEQSTEIETPLPGLFELFTGVLEEIAAVGAKPRLLFAFELKLLKALGLSPSTSKTDLKPATRSLVTALTRDDWQTIRALHPPACAVRELNAFLHGFLIYHLGKLARGRAIALGS